MDIVFDIRIIVFTLIVAAIGFFSWEYHEKNITIANQQSTIVKQQIAVAADQQVIVNTQKSDAVTNATQTAVAVQTQQVETKHQVIQNQVATKTTQIEQSFSKLPDTPANQKAESDQLAKVEIDGLWNDYCTAMPGDPQCKTNATPVPDTDTPTSAPITTGTIGTADIIIPTMMDVEENPNLEYA
jgi:hypothetical protein